MTTFTQKRRSSVSFKPRSLTWTKVHSETGRTLAAFQVSDSFGSISNMSHYYSLSNSGHVKRRETKRQKVRAWRTNRTAFHRQTLHLSCHLTASSPSPRCVCRGLHLLDTISCSLTSSRGTGQQPYPSSWRSWGLITSRHRSKHVSVLHSPNEAASAH